jgi:AAA+ superfamily predicted ATPase
MINQSSNISAQDFERELDVCLRARFTIVVVSTMEEERALKVIKNVCDKRSRPVFTWDIADGFGTLSEGTEKPSSTLDALGALNDIEKSKNDAVYVLLDFHDSWEFPPVKRKLRTLSEKLKYTRKTIILLTPSNNLPTELKNSSVFLDFPLPDIEELNDTLETILKTPGVKVSISNSDREELIRSALGLTSAQAQRVFARAVVHDGKLTVDDIRLVIEEKKAIIRQSRALEFCPSYETPQNVGGLEILKEWLNLRSKAFSREASNYGLNPPKGVALIGISGTGKSLSAKMIAGLWHVPLLRLDMGAIFQKWYGESEENIRSALKIAEAIAPCVMWIDEIEKAMGNQGDSDGGTSQRVFGTILTWMQEKKSPVFVVATANDITKLPPELFRRGRFDEIFFLDLPTQEERSEIFTVHISKRGRDAKNYNISKLATESHGYVGAEIEQSIIDAMIIGFNQEREFTTEDILSCIKRQVPLSISQKEKITELQSWLDSGRAQPASKHGGGDAERAKLKKELGFR